jgi:hypothetical protein
VSVTTAPPAPGPAGPDGGFAPVLRAEWTKLRTVRGWVVALLVSGLVTVALGLLTATGSRCSEGPFPGHPQESPCTGHTGPGGEAVTDSFYFAHRSLAGDGSLTARVTSLANGPGWSKTGLIIKQDTRPGSAYAAIMATGGHGVRMQYNFTEDVAGLPGALSPASPRWLRLVRAGRTITGYSSLDGTHWTRVASATLDGLPSTVQAGLFTTSPPNSHVSRSSLGGSRSVGSGNLAVGSFDHVSVQGGFVGGGSWHGDQIGGDPGPLPGASGLRQAAGVITVSGAGDIAPAVSGGATAGIPIETSLVGIFGGLIALSVVAAMFVTTEYRRGLIRLTLVASPQRGRVLAAKAMVIGAAGFVTGLAAAAVALPLGTHLLRANGNVVFPISGVTLLRVLAGAGALFAVSAILALAVGTVLRRSAATISVLIAAMVLPYLLAVSNVLPDSASAWLLKVTPAAGFAILQSLPRYAQVASAYAPVDGYFPLAPWAGFAVLCCWAALALALGGYLLNRRDA